MTKDEVIRMADDLDQNVQIDQQTSEDEPGGYRSELDELMADAASTLRSQHAHIAELEAMLSAVGAGLVGCMLPDTQQEAPLHCDVCGVECSNPWHFSTETERHKHACDTCWDRVRTHIGLFDTAESAHVECMQAANCSAGCQQ